jgi:hypothetical protein
MTHVYRQCISIYKNWGYEKYSLHVLKIWGILIVMIDQMQFVAGCIVGMAVGQLLRYIWTRWLK